MKKIITFIIPSYNVEKYLDKCLSSFLNPKVIDQLEVIIVNDGSNDGTELKAQKYVRKYPDSYQIINKVNGGHGSTINIGSKVARGKYFKIIDADDWVVTENLEEFIERLAECDTDVVITPFHMVDMETGEKREHNMDPRIIRHRITLEEIVEQWHSYEGCMVFHGITYKTEFYYSNYHILPEHVFYEDHEYAAIPCCCAKSLSVFDIYIYQYLVGNSTQSISLENQLKRIQHIEQIIDDLINYYNDVKELTNTGKEFLYLKIENVILIYYLTTFIFESNKSKGMKNGIAFNRRLIRLNHEIYKRTLKKYYIYLLLNRLRISPRFYQQLIESRLYNKIKRKY